MDALKRPALLRPLRGMIDAVDDALLVLLATRARIAGVAARSKRHHGLPRRDPARETRIHARAQRVAARVGVAPGTASALIDLALGQVADGADATPRSRVLAWIPPPRRLAPALGLIPKALQARAVGSAIRRVLAGPLAAGSLAVLQGRRLGVDVTDLDLHWVIGLSGDRLALVPGEPDARVRGTSTDLLLLAARLEDADTLFFQRRLVLTGDTELGLAARNLLEGLPWEQLPLGLRIGLDRGARLARAARSSHSGTTTAA